MRSTKRAYADADIQALLREREVDDAHAKEAFQSPESSQLPLHVFDDHEFECRSPERWIAMGTVRCRLALAFPLRLTLARIDRFSLAACHKTESCNR